MGPGEQSIEYIEFLKAKNLKDENLVRLTTVRLSVRETGVLESLSGGTVRLRLLVVLFESIG